MSKHVLQRCTCSYSLVPAVQKGEYHTLHGQVYLTSPMQTCVCIQHTCVMRVARLCPPAWWGSLPRSPLPWGTGPMQGSLVQSTIIKGFACCNGDDCKVLAALFANALMCHNRAVNALNAVGAPLGAGTLELLHCQQNGVVYQHDLMKLRWA